MKMNIEQYTNVVLSAVAARGGNPQIEDWSEAQAISIGFEDGLDVLEVSGYIARGRRLPSDAN